MVDLSPLVVVMDGLALAKFLAIRSYTLLAKMVHEDCTNLV